MLTKLMMKFFQLNGPLFLLLLCSTVYVVLVLRLKKIISLKNLKIQTRIPLIDKRFLNKLVQTDIIEKVNIVSFSFLIGFHLLVLVLSLLLLLTNVNSFDLNSRDSNTSVPDLEFSSDYRALIDGKKQAELLSDFCKENHLNSICEINDQINDQISKRLENLKSHLKLTENDLNDSNDKNSNDEVALGNDDRRDLKDSNLKAQQNQKKDADLNSEKQCNVLDNRKSNDERTDLINNFYLAELDNFLSGQIGAAFLGFIAVLLSLAHYLDTVISGIFEFKINKLIKNLDVSYQELNYTHIVERVLTPFAIYFDFKYSNNPTYLWFTISWCLINVIIRFGYLKLLSNEKAIGTKLLLNDLLRIKVIFYSSLLLLSSYLMSDSSADELPNAIKIFNLFYSLTLFLTSLSDWDWVLKQENRPINLDANNNELIIPNGKLEPNMTSMNKYNNFSSQPNMASMNKYNNTSSYSNLLTQPVCNLSRKY